MAIHVGGFLLCSLIIFFSAKKLSYYGDVIAEKSGLGKMWIGLLLMSTVTSLPELGIGISSVRLVGSADLAVGNVLGSCAFNLALLSLLDALIRHEPLFSKVAQSQVLAATLGIMLIAIAGVGLVLSSPVLFGRIGIISIVLAIVYLASIKLLHSFSKKEADAHPFEGPQDPDEKRSGLRKAIGWYAVHACIVIAASLVIPFFAENIAKQTGLGESFVGTLFLAASTSLPEVAICISAVKLGAVDIAVGNLFGSNIFNVFILAIDDPFYRQGDLLNASSESHTISILATIIMSCIAVAGLTFHHHRKKFFLALDTLLILLVYLGNIVILFYSNKGESP